MSASFQAWKRAALAAALALCGPWAAAEPASPSIPAPLAQWRGWVEESNPRRGCAEPDACVWMGALHLEASSPSARFSFEARNDAATPQPIRLPGDASRWPEARVNGKAALIQDKAGEPYVALPPGASRVEGEIELSAEAPLPVDPRLGWARLGAGAQARSVLIQRGSLEWAGASGSGTGKGEARAQGALAERPEAQIYRKLTDGQAPSLTTRVRIVSDTLRKTVRIQGLLPEGSEPYAIQGAKARWEKGVLAVDVSAGVTLVEVVSRLSADLKTVFARPSSEDLALEAREYWFSEPDPRLRRLIMSGSPIDPGSLPAGAAWEGLPAYEKSDRSALQISAKAQEQEERPLTGSVATELWLDFSGSGSSIRQTLRGSSREAGALEAKGWDLRHARINGAPALVALGREGGKKVAYPPGEVTAELFARSAQSWAPSVPAALGGPYQAEAGEIVAHAPPGWRFVGVWGAGSSGDGWAASFSLWDWFLIIVISWGARRLFGWRWASLAGAGLIAGKLFAGAPLEMFLPLLALPAALRALPDGGLRRFVAGLGLLAAAVMAASLAPHTIGRVQKTLHTSMDDREQPGARGWFNAAPRARASLAPAASASREIVNLKESSVYGDASAPAPASAPEPTQRPGALGAPQAGEGEPSWAWLEARASLSAPASDQTQTRLVFIKPWLVKCLSALSLAGAWALFLLCARASVWAWRRDQPKRSAS